MINSLRSKWRDADFRKSSYSGGENGACVELAWRKSSYSGGANGACVEVTHADDEFGVRDSKNQAGPVLAMSEQQGHAFLAAVKRGQLRSS